MSHKHHVNALFFCTGVKRGSKKHARWSCVVPHLTPCASKRGFEPLFTRLRDFYAPLVECTSAMFMFLAFFGSVLYTSISKYTWIMVCFRRSVSKGGSQKPAVFWRPWKPQKPPFFPEYAKMARFPVHVFLPLCVQAQHRMSILTLSLKRTTFVHGLKKEGRICPFLGCYFHAYPPCRVLGRNRVFLSFWHYFALFLTLFGRFVHESVHNRVIGWSRFPVLPHFYAMY